MSKLKEKKTWNSKDFKLNIILAFFGDEKKISLSSKETPTTAFILSLIAGILMLIGGVLSASWFMGGGSTSNYYNNQGMMGGFSGMMTGLGGMMDGYASMMNGLGVPSSFMGGLSIIGFIAGIIVLIGGIMLNVSPASHMTWGIVILVFSVISLAGMGGFYIGALLGIAGGALALSWRPAKTT